MKKTKKSKQRKPKSTSKQTKLTDNKSALKIGAVIMTVLMVCLLCFMVRSVQMQNQAHNYCVVYNAQTKLSNLAMEKLTIYTDRQYPTQHAIDCPDSVAGLEWIN